MSLFKPIIRWIAVLVGAAIGSYAGRAGAAAYRGEPVEPLLRLDRAALMRSDIVPGFLAVELTGKVLNLGPWSAALVAAAAAGTAAFIEGPLTPTRGREAISAPATDGAAPAN